MDAMLLSCKRSGLACGRMSHPTRGTRHSAPRVVLLRLELEEQ